MNRFNDVVSLVTYAQTRDFLITFPQMMSCLATQSFAFAPAFVWPNKPEAIDVARWQTHASAPNNLVVK
jgi:hypothetical protein